MKNKTILNALFNPRKIAVIGASSKSNKVGSIILQRLKSSNTELFPVHPKETEIQGYKVYNTVESLPDGIDIALITIGAANAVTAAEQCAEKGVKFLVVVAGGFGETGEKGRVLEERLISITKNYNTRILGPNSLGVFFPETGLDTIFVEHGDKALAGGGSIAFISQSGSVGVEALGLTSNTGYEMRAFVGLGNKIDLGEIDFLKHFENDPGTNCLAFYIENIGSGRVFLEAAGKVSRKKPVVILKAGRTEAGSSAVSSHTGKLAGSDKVINGAFRQYGLQRAFDDEELCDASKAFSMLPPAKGNKIAIITAAGGYGVMCADYIEQNDKRAQLKMAKLSPETETVIKEANFAFASSRNPVDITASADDEAYVKTLEAILKDDNVDIAVCVAFFSPPAISVNLINLISEMTQKYPKPVLVFTQYGPFTDSYLKKFHDAGVVGFSSIFRTIRAARFLVERAEISEALGEDK